MKLAVNSTGDAVAVKIIDLKDSKDIENSTRKEVFSFTQFYFNDFSVINVAKTLDRHQQDAFSYQHSEVLWPQKR